MPRVVAIYVAVYVFRRRAGEVEFLQLQRSAGRWMSGTWQPVYGKIMGTEPAWQAALRELREETGLVPVGFYQVETVSTFYDARDDAIHHCSSFAAEVAADAKVTLNPEHADYRWIDSRVAEAGFLWPTQQATVREIIREIVAEGPAKPYLRIESG